MTPTKERMLKVVLCILAIDAALRGLLTIFASKWALSHSFPNIPASEITTFLLLINQEFGALDVGLSIMLFQTLFHPERNAAVIDGIAVALALVSMISLVSIYNLGITDWFPAFSAWGHSLLRIAVAVLLIYLCPHAHLRANRNATV